MLKILLIASILFNPILLVVDQNHSSDLAENTSETESQVYKLPLADIFITAQNNPDFLSGNL